MKHNPQPKPLFVERMKELLGESYEKYWKKIQEEPSKSIRVNTLKISVKELKKRLEEKSWILKQPFKDYPEIMIVEGKKSASDSERKIIDLQPGELGRSLEHMLGYYYIQELASMLPVLVLQPKPNEIILDLCSSPGSKTTQIAAKMQNLGVLIANEVSIKRIKILANNLERCGVSNVIITKKSGEILCEKLKKENFAFDKILIDAPCSGEGTIRSTPKTLLMWSINTIKALSKVQKKLLSSAIDILKPSGKIVYSTCTHAPEENEDVLDFILKKFPNVKIEKITLPVKFNEGVTRWKDKVYLEDVKYSCRIYPHISDTEGFFIAKLRKTEL